MVTRRLLNRYSITAADYVTSYRAMELDDPALWLHDTLCFSGLKHIFCCFLILILLPCSAEAEDGDWRREGK